MDIQSLETFTRYLASVHRRTQGVARCIPDDRVEWRTADGRFSPGDIVRHIALTKRWMWAENVLGQPSRYPGAGPEHGATKEEVLDLLDRMHDQTVQIVSRLGPEDLHAMCTTVGGVDLPTWKWLRLMVEHEIHHRGQLYEVLAQMGVDTPPLYGLTEPEVLARSEPPSC